MSSRRRANVIPLSKEELQAIYAVADDCSQARASMNHFVLGLINRGWATGKRPRKNARDITLTDEYLAALLSLAKTLRRIRAGEDARLIFRQNERTKPSKQNEYIAAATIYWAARARDPAAGDAPALQAVQSAISGVSELSPQTIRKAAQRYRKDALSALEGTPLPGSEHPNSLKIHARIAGILMPLLSPAELGPLREYLRKKSAHESNVDGKVA